MDLARPDERETWPYHSSLRLFTIVRCVMVSARPITETKNCERPQNTNSNTLKICPIKKNDNRVVMSESSHRARRLNANHNNFREEGGGGVARLVVFFSSRAKILWVFYGSFPTCAFFFFFKWRFGGLYKDALSWISPVERSELKRRETVWKTSFCLTGLIRDLPKT